MTRSRILSRPSSPAEPVQADDGIASKYRRDKGIENDPAVVFTENFDGGSLDVIAKRWESVKNKEILSLSPDVPEAGGDGKSLLMTHVGGKDTGATTATAVHISSRRPGTIASSAAPPFTAAATAERTCGGSPGMAIDRGNTLPAYFFRFGYLNAGLPVLSYVHSHTTER